MAKTDSLLHHTSTPTHHQRTKEYNQTHSSFILFVDLDGFVCLRCHQPTPTLIKGGHEDAGLTVQRTRLHCCLDLLEVVASFPVPEMQTPIVAYTHSITLHRCVTYVHTEFRSEAPIVTPHAFHYMGVLHTYIQNLEVRLPLSPHTHSITWVCYIRTYRI